MEKRFSRYDGWDEKRLKAELKVLRLEYHQLFDELQEAIKNGSPSRLRYVTLNESVCDRKITEITNILNKIPPELQTYYGNRRSESFAPPLD